MPFLRILIFLAGGILIQQPTNTVVLNSQVLFALLLSTITFLLIFYQFWRRVYSLRWIPGFAIATLFLIIGLILSNHQTPQKLTTAVATKGVGIITTVEYRNNHRIRITLKPEAYQQPTPLRKKDQLLLMVQGPLDMIPQEGDRLFFNGEIRPLPTPTNPEAFDYGQYLHNNGFSGQAYFYPKDIVIEPSKQFDYRFLPTKIRNQCLIIFQNSGLSEPGLTIVQALLLGDRTALDPEIQNSFIRSGAIHLLAVSGLHVGIIYILLGGFLSLFFKPSNVISILLSLGFLFSYAFITGFSPSVSRAALMFAVIHMGRVTNRNTNIYNSLAVSATLLLIINPLFLYHVGFR
jgi:competence protein ComEC